MLTVEHTRLLRHTLRLAQEEASFLDEIHSCKELQNIMMDIESSLQHLKDLVETGPSAPYVDVPLVESEVDEEEDWRANRNDPSVSKGMW